MSKQLERLIRPDEYHMDLLQIDFDDYARKDFRLVMLDIDNTLAEHGSVSADDFAREAVGRIRAAGLDCWIVSNGRTRRIRSFASSLDLPFIAMANKPSTRALKKVCKTAGVDRKQAVMVGDQLLTDIFSAKRAGCLAVLVRPRFKKEALNIRIKRLIEKVVLRRLKLH